MEMLRRHARTVRILLAGVLLAVFFLGAGSFVLERTREVERALKESEGVSVTEPTLETGGCDGLPGVPECPPPDLADAPTLEGALERYRLGKLREFDAVHLLLTQNDYDTALADILGPSQPGIGMSVPENALWTATLGDIPRAGSFTWMQQWVLPGDAVLFEQVFVLPQVADTGKFLANHRGHMQGFGIDPWQGGAFGDGTNEPVLYRFQDADAAMPARRCVNRALRVLDRIVFAVTLVSGGDCTTPPPELVAVIVSGIVARADNVIP